MDEDFFTWLRVKLNFKNKCEKIFIISYKYFIFENNCYQKIDKSK